MQYFDNNENLRSELRKNKKYLAKYMSLYILGKKKINILKAIDHQMNNSYYLLHYILF